MGPCTRSTRPLACGELAAMIRMPSFPHIRPNWVTGASPRTFRLPSRLAHTHSSSPCTGRAEPRSARSSARNTHRRPDRLFLRENWPATVLVVVDHVHQTAAPARALPATHESCRPSAPTRQSALCVLAADDTACAVVALRHSPACFIQRRTSLPPARLARPGVRRQRRTEFFITGAPVSARCSKLLGIGPVRARPQLPCCSALAPPPDTAPRSAGLPITQLQQLAASLNRKLPTLTRPITSALLSSFLLNPVLPNLGSSETKEL